MMISRPRVPSDDYGTRILACFALTMCVFGFFWAYDAIAKRGPAYVPSFTQATGGDAQGHGGFASIELLNPDMNSAAVTTAKSDVPATAQPQPAEAVYVPADGPPKKVARQIVPKKKMVRIAQSKSRARAREAYAQAPNFFAPFGQF